MKTESIVEYTKIIDSLGNLRAEVYNKFVDSERKDQKIAETLNTIDNVTKTVVELLISETNLLRK